MHPLRPAVFFDRDGVLNDARIVNGRPHPPRYLSELQIVPEATVALRALVDAGYLLIGVTNQPDVARGTQQREVVEEINATILATLPLVEILICYHDDADNCDCRKPRPGLLIEAAKRYSIDLRRSYLIGDRWKDVEAGQRAGCHTILIGDGYAERTNANPPTRRTASLADAVEWILIQSDEMRESTWTR